jgi:hypothetical protein
MLINGKYFQPFELIEPIEPFEPFLDRHEDFLFHAKLAK